METIVRIKILSDLLSPEEITSRLGSKPDRVWHKGNVREISRNMAKFNGWIMDAGSSRQAPIKEQVAMLLEKLKPLRTELNEIAALASVDLSIVVYSDYEPPLHFDNATLGEIASLGANLDIDLYIRTNDGEGS
jgi:hypothetical protein